VKVVKLLRQWTYHIVSEMYSRVISIAWDLRRRKRRRTRGINAVDFTFGKNRPRGLMVLNWILDYKIIRGS